MSFSNDDEAKEYILARIKEDLKDCENYQDTIVKKTIRERYQIYYADEKYYNKKMPNLSKRSSLVDTSVADTIEWALPSLVRLFFGSENPVTIHGVYDSDEKSAEVMSELISYQLMRKNNAFLVFYNWFKDALITGLGVVKCYWEREEKHQELTTVLNQNSYMALVNTPGVQVLSVEAADEFGNLKVAYEQSTYVKNNPKVENILISEFIFPANCKNLTEANFVAHKKRVTMSYLKQKELEGWYANVDKINEGATSILEDDIEQDLNDNYTLFNNPIEKARREVVLYECYTKMDLNGDGVLEDLIITVCENVILRIEENIFGRHPFFVLSPSRDPHRVFPKRSFAEMIGQLQDLKTALIRQIMINVALSNDPRMIMSEDAINIEDYISGKTVIRKKPGYSMGDVAMPMPLQPLHPWTFQFLEYIEGQKESRTGITRYNQGLDASSLNKTATGINAIMSASNQRLELIARMFAETGISEMYRFIISLNQKFMDRDTVIRVTDRELKITPDDLNGEIDLVVNAGVGVSTKEQNLMNLQTLMTAIMQVMGSGIQVSTPTNIYNLMKRWISETGIKNIGDYLTDPAVIQARMIMDIQLKMQFIQTLPLPLQQQYMMTGTLPPEVLQQLPPEIQLLIGGTTFGTNPQGNTAPGNPNIEFGGAGAGISGGLGTGVSGMDNRKPQGMQSERPSPVA